MLFLEVETLKNQVCFEFLGLDGIGGHRVERNKPEAKEPIQNDPIHLCFIEEQIKSIGHISKV